jgi:hypothetical protein
VRRDCEPCTEEAWLCFLGEGSGPPLVVYLKGSPFCSVHARPFANSFLDNPIISEDDDPTVDASTSTDRRDSPSSLAGVPAGSITNDGSLTDGGPSGGGVGQEPPASAGRIHDYFTEYEKRFGIGRMKPQPQKQNTARSCLHNNTNYSGSVTEPFPQPVYDEEPRTVANDDVNVEQPTDVAREDLDAVHFSGAELEDESTSQPGQEGDRTKDRNRECWVRPSFHISWRTKQA